MRKHSIIRISALTALVTLTAMPALFAQGGRGGRGGAPVAPQAAAPIDLTGMWVSVVTEDWMFRMVTPPKGEYLGVPMTQAARQAADKWDPAADEASGNACKAYGGGALMRVPGRLRISWTNSTTLRIEAEAGTQTRLLHFDMPQPDITGNLPPQGEHSWQGNSAAVWEFGNTARGAQRRGNLKVVTTGLKAGYLRKNGVPYSENAIVTEYIDVHTASNGDVWLVDTVAVHDPMNLTTDFITSSHFKKIPDNSPWKPEPCTAN